MNLVVYSEKEWKGVSEAMHSFVFDEHRDKDMSRIDFAIAIWDKEDPLGYITCREFDAESIYIGFGGVLPQVRGKGKTKQAFEMALDHLKYGYHRAFMIIKNDNLKMLKLAMNCGFKINGVRVVGGDILLEHILEWGAE